MATNKRKEAAALFELLDKSTLKVPKNGSGSLKIPSWWSSKTNPTPAENKGAEKLAAKPPADPAPAAESKPAALSSPTLERKPTPNGHSSTTPQAVTSAPPAIRPPGRLAAAATPAPPVAEKFEPTPLTSAPSHSSAAPQVFAPNTMNPGTSLPARRRPGGIDAMGKTLSKAPLWIWALIAIPVLLIVVFLAYRTDRSHTPAAGNLSNTSSDGSGTSSLVVPNPEDPARIQNPSPTPTPTPQPVPVNPIPQHEQPDPPPPQPTKGQVIPAGQIDWKAHKYFLVVATFTRLEVANRGATFLADHGVDCTVVKDRRGNYLLIAADGMNRQADPAAMALRDRVVQIGRVHPDAIKRHSGHGVWDDAYYYNVTR